MKKLVLFTFTLLFSVTIMAQVQDTIPEQDKPQEEQQVEQQQEQQQEKKQKKEKTPISKKLYFGGGLGVTFGNYTRVAVYPMVGYKLTPKLSAGVELGYEWINDKRYSEDYSTSNYGWSIFTRYRVIPSLFAHVEYAMYNYEYGYWSDESYREWVPFLFLGAGFSRQLARGTTVYAMVKFDVIQDENSPYSNWDPFFSVGVSVGF